MELANPNDDWHYTPAKPMAPRVLAAGLLVSLALHSLLLWLFNTPGKPVLDPVAGPLTIELRRTAEPVAADDPEPQEVAPAQEDPQPIQPEKPRTEPTQTAADPAVPTPAPEVEAPPERSLFRHDIGESRDPQFAPESDQHSNSSIFHPGLRQSLGEARSRPRGGPPKRSGEIETYTNIAGQQVVRHGNDCFVLLPGADRLDGRSFAPVPCGGKNASEKFADRLRDALREGAKVKPTDRLP